MSSINIKRIPTAITAIIPLDSFPILLVLWAISGASAKTRVCQIQVRCMALFDFKEPIW